MENALIAIIIAGLGIMVIGLIVMKKNKAK